MSQFSNHAFLSSATKISKSFGNHLHSALSNAGIRAFSVDELDIDENRCKEFQKTIQGSRILIVVFSKDYTSSERCLDELVFILESRRAFGRFVLPVFYDVDPSEVRKQKGCFEQDFLMYEERYKSGIEGRRLEWLQKVKKWKTALTEVADLGGMVLQNQSDGCESRFIQEIVKVVAGKLNRTVLNVALHPVGIDSRVKDINLWLQDGSTSVDMMAIYGMGGIGKSTLAKTAYGLNFDKFDGSSFLADVNKTSERHDGLVSLQRQLLSNVLGKKVEKIYNVDEGVIKIQEAIRCRRILLVLDDVNDRDQLNTILGMREWFYPGSKIIITTRNQHLFDASEACSCKMYKVTPLNVQESIRLFSWHAFGEEKPPEDHEDLSEKVILHCKGNPLALKVLGSSLCDKSIEVWESALRKLKAIPDNKILEKLRISYDLLPDDDIQNIFLDIVCFFVGKDKEYAVTILDGCGFFSVVGIQILSDRCLIEMEKDKLKLHSLIQDMGREIIRVESPWEPSKRSRVWPYKDSFNILSLKTGTEKIEGLVLDKGMSTRLSKVVRSVRSYFFSEDTGLVGDGYSRKRRKNLENFDDASTEGSNSIEFEADAFSRMQRLRILQLSYVRFTGFYCLFPESLRLLCWSGFHMKTIPEDLPLESLVALEMKKSYLEKTWDGIKILRSLKILNFSHSHFLKETPDFSGLPHLKTLILKDCIKLVKIHESIGCLGGLVYLNLRDCKNLRTLPGSFCKLKSLEKLIISGCSRLVTSAIELGKLESLTTLQADGMNFGYQLASVGGNVNSWRTIWKTWSSKLRRSPGSDQFSFSSLSSSLVSLSLAKCNLTDDALSFGFNNLPSLCFLNLSENLIYNLPQSIKNHGRLQDLWLDGCLSLVSLPELPSSLVKLKAVRCSSLQTVTNLPNLMTTLFLDVMESESLTEVSGIFKLKHIDNFEVEILNTLGLLLKLDNKLDTEVEIHNRFTSTKRIYSVQQGLYEFGIFSTYFPGNEVPSWFNNKSEQRFLTLNVDSLPNIKITGLLICIVYARSSPRIFHFFGGRKYGGAHTIDIKVENISKGLKWIYAPSFIGIPEENNMLTFLCHWNFGKYLQTGDQINVSLPCWSKTFKMKEFGVTLAYNNPELDQFSASTSEESVMEGFMPLYQLAVHHYYLSHPEYYVVRDNADFVVRSILNEKLFGDHYVQTAGSNDGAVAEEEDDDDSFFDYDEDEDEEAALAELEEMLQRSW